MVPDIWKSWSPSWRWRNVSHQEKMLEIAQNGLNDLRHRTWVGRYPRDANETCMCAAIYDFLKCDEYDLGSDIDELLLQEINNLQSYPLGQTTHERIIAWNDAPGRTKEHVTHIFMSVIKKLISHQ